MQKLAEICIKRPIFAVMLILALVVVGAASYFRLGVDRFPAVDLPTVMVRTILPGGAPEDAEAEISDEIEAAVNTVEGIRELRSISSAGFSLVIATFDLSRDIDAATDDVRSRVQGVMNKLPVGTELPTVTKMDNESSPIMTLALSGERSIRELSELANQVVKVQLERASGVGEVLVIGGQARAIKVWVDADRLAAYNLSIAQVRTALAAQNSNIPGGNVTSQRSEETLRTMGRLRDPRGFQDLVIATVHGAPVRLRDIGHTEDGTYEQRNAARLNGVPTVTLEVRRQSGANTVATIEAAKLNLARARAQLPADVKVELLRDQSEYIYAALHEINLHLVLGSILACLVVLAFMRSWRSMIIAGVAIPASVISTFGMMAVLGFTLNSVTMLALVLMVGIVIDDAIVVLENIFRFVDEKQKTPFEAAVEATREIGLAVLATTLSLVVIFLPVSFMSSISGRFLYQFGITAAVAIMVSLLVSFSLTPMMSARLLAPQSTHESREGFYAWLDAKYAAALAWALRHQKLVATVGALVILSSWPLYRQVRQEYIPSQVDEGEFELQCVAPQTASIGAMDDVMRSIDVEVRAVPGVRISSMLAGGAVFGGVNQGNGYVRIAPYEERVFSLTRLLKETLQLTPWKAFQGNYSQQDVMLEVRRRLKRFRELRCAVRNVPSFNIGSGPFDIDFSICGPELAALAQYAEQLRERAEQLGGIVDADTTLKLDRPERRVIIDRERAADLGVRTEDIASALRLGVGGDEEVSRFRDESMNENYDVQLRLVQKDREHADVIQRLYVPRTPVAGQPTQLVRLDSLVKIESALSPSRIDRLDRERVAAVRAGVGPGFALQDRLDALHAAAKELDMPAAYSTRVMGKGRELEKTFGEFIWAFLLSIVFMYMILATQFESLIHPFTILLSLPLSVPFALLSLWATGNTLNLYSALGMLVLFGVVKKNSILQVDHMNKLRAEGHERMHAILQANRDRLRPILMTTLALVAGMLPLWLGTGPGAEERRAIAVVVIGGQSLSLLLTLIVTPVAYALLDDLRGARAEPARHPVQAPHH
ncbi:MAG TPA: efflux RND transporter permease subunit [Polyangiales bacterium]|nr:efflux RND transporter permease subunit [Polyangiales bacterium]